jgi:hypothetical protein
MAEALLITRDDVVKFTSLNGNVDPDKFIQYIKIAQDLHIQSYLGTDLFEKIKTDIILASSGIPTLISITNTGTGYATSTGNTTTALVGTGTGLTLDITDMGGLVTVADIDTAGTGYKVNDVSIIDDGNDDAEITIDEIFTIPTNYNNLLNTYIKPMLIHWAMVEYLPYSAYTIGNKGVYKHSAESSENIDRLELSLLIDKQTQTANHYSTRFVDYMCFNQALFPEYNSNSNGDIYPNSNTNFTNWVL